jgi:hypothetical protein
MRTCAQEVAREIHSDSRFDCGWIARNVGSQCPRDSAVDLDLAHNRWVGLIYHSLGFQLENQHRAATGLQLALVCVALNTPSSAL